MASAKDLANVWRNIREFELTPIEQEALKPVRIALVGAPGSGRHTLAAQMRSDPARPDVRTQSPLLLLEPAGAERARQADLIILVLDSTQRDFSAQQALLRGWVDDGLKTLVFWNKMDLLDESQALAQELRDSSTLYGSALNLEFLRREFVPAVLHILPDQRLALGRQFPLFRLTLAHQIINEACMSNAAYAFSTGLAETVPVLDIPLNIADMVVLTKAQAFMVYRLGLLLGFSTRWQDYLAEFGSVIGGGFLWRQLARQLVGLIPVWGILPKVAVSYAGTYSVGQAILQWYLTGRHLSPAQINALYVEALARGKEKAQQLLARTPRPKLGMPKIGLPQLKLPQFGWPRRRALPAPATADEPVAEILLPPTEEPVDAAEQLEAEPAVVTPAVVTPAAAKPDETPAVAELQPEETFLEDEPAEYTAPEDDEPLQSRHCPDCGRSNAPDARFCQYCGWRF